MEDIILQDMGFFNEQEAIHQWSFYGKYYGYPQCCIDEFCDFYKWKTDRSRQFLASNGTGFVPCPIHAERILSGEIKIEDLIQNRKHDKHFLIE